MCVKRSFRKDIYVAREWSLILFPCLDCGSNVDEAGVFRISEGVRGTLGASTPVAWLGYAEQNWEVDIVNAKAALP